jgi:hypothetical protein
MDSIRVSEAPDPGSIPGEATNSKHAPCSKGAFYFAQKIMLDDLEK